MLFAALELSFANGRKNMPMWLQIYLQSTWKLELDWDEQLPADLKEIDRFVINYRDFDCFFFLRGSFKLFIKDRNYVASNSLRGGGVLVTVNCKPVDFI